MGTTVYLGNRDAVQVVRDAEGVETRTLLPPGKRCTVIQPPDDITLADLFTTITNPGGGAWGYHSDGPPAWVAVDSDSAGFAGAVATLLATHYGCEIRQPDPEEA